MESREKIRRAFGGSEELPDALAIRQKVARDTARNVLGASSRKMKEDLMVALVGLGSTEKQDIGEDMVYVEG